MKASKSFKVHVIFLALIPCTLSCVKNQKDTTDDVIIEGVLKYPIISESVSIEKISEGQLQGSFPLMIDKKGNFMTVFPVKEPSFYRLNFYDRQYVNLILTGKEGKVYVEADGDNPNGFYNIKGSRDTQFLENIKSADKKRKREEQLLNAEAMNARRRGDLTELNDIISQFEKADSKNLSNIKSKIWESIPSLAAVYGVSLLDLNDENFEFLESVLERFDRELPGNKDMLKLKARIDVLKRVRIGEDAPDFKLNNPKGETVSLSSLRGNYVLIDFWASWCKPCRIENPKVKRLYEEYNDRNFEILGVSLDRSEDHWKRAIIDDDLPWPQVWDQGSEVANTFEVFGIPATYLIGPNGKIIAKGLRGVSLEEKLKEIFS